MPAWRPAPSVGALRSANRLLRLGEFWPCAGPQAFAQRLEGDVERRDREDADGRGEDHAAEYRCADRAAGESFLREIRPFVWRSSLDFGSKVIVPGTGVLLNNEMDDFATSPLTPNEFLAATMAMSLMKVSAVSLVMAAAAWLFYSYSVLAIGLALMPFVANLIVTGWVIGVLTTSLIMRFGQEAEVLAWSMVFLFQPISCVFYPLEVLPPWLQTIAWGNPASHIFEGMRLVINQGGFPSSHLAWALGLNAVGLALVVGWFHYTFGLCKEKGLLVRVGE